ncbi:unnamed protein product [Leptosia nina]|uniref:pseudouridine 5'-phosphatase n=1 Tax=Leptosia nina TaxID=320188 RepID=A0AAV1J875_9NEOP
MGIKPVTHVLFDMDGLLLNTEDLYTELFQNIVSKYGKNYTFDLKMKLMGSQAHETAEIITSELDLPMTPEEFQQECQKGESLFANCKLMPGAKSLIEHLHKHNVPMALATSSGEDSYHLKVDKNHSEIFSLFPYKTFGSSDPTVKQGKPHPDIFLVTAAKFPERPAPEKCLVLEDAVNGVKSAVAAGMQVVVVPDTRIDKALLTEATQILNSLEEFKPELFGLPPFDD